MLYWTLSAHEMMIVGHRGACGYEPENTLSSFQKAMDLGVKMVELDVYVCATGELVVIHDPGVALRAMPKSVSCKYHDIGEMSFDLLQSVVFAGKEKIPTLAEVIDLVDRKIPLNIELKGPGTAKPVAKLLQKYFQSGWVSTDFVVSSFDHGQIDTLHKLLPSIKTGVLFHTTMKSRVRQWLTKILPVNVLDYIFSHEYKQIVQIAHQHHASFIGVAAGAVNHELVRIAHEAGFLVFVWTVNDKKTADSLRVMSVDGIFSNYPDRV